MIHGRAKLIASRRQRLLCLVAAAVAISCWSGFASAQELNPRAYWPAPKGLNVVVLAYQYNSGDIVTDPSLPVSGVDSGINYVQFGYVRSLDVFGRSANAQINLPFTWGTTKGTLQGESVERYIEGLTDLRARFAINLRGAPTMDGAGYRALRAEPRTIFGTSLLIQAPTGAYESDKVLNAGTNRWSIKPAVGMIWPFYRTWMLEAEVGVWLFGENDDFLGMTREQRPIMSSEFHLIKRFRPGFWAALDANFYTGGQTIVDGEEKADLQRNSRVGATLMYPFKGRHALRGSYSTGIVTESGGDFEIFSLNYLYAWF